MKCIITCLVKRMKVVAKCYLNWITIIIRNMCVCARAPLFYYKSNQVSFYHNILNFNYYTSIFSLIT